MCAFIVYRKLNILVRLSDLILKFITFFLCGVPFISAMCERHSSNNNVYLTNVIPLINMYKALYNIYRTIIKTEVEFANDVH